MGARLSAQMAGPPRARLRIFLGLLYPVCHSSRPRAVSPLVPGRSGRFAPHGGRVACRYERAPPSAGVVSLRPSCHLRPHGLGLPVRLTQPSATPPTAARQAAFLREVVLFCDFPLLASNQVGWYVLLNFTSNCKGAQLPMRSYAQTFFCVRNLAATL